MKLFDFSAGNYFNILPEASWEWVVKLLGAVLGSAVSIAYVLPKGRQEAAIRFLVGVMIGVTFGNITGQKIVETLELNYEFSRLEIILMGSTFASLCAWWALGLIRRVLENSRFGKDLNNQ